MITSTTQIRVRYAETDQMNVVYHGNFAQYFEVARVEFIREFGLSYKQIEEMGIVMPVFEINIKYLRPATYDELLTIKTELRENPISYKIHFHHEVYNERNELITIANVVLVTIDAKTRLKTTLPESLLNEFKKYFSESN